MRRILLIVRRWYVSEAVRVDRPGILLGVVVA